MKRKSCNRNIITDYVIGSLFFSRDVQTPVRKDKNGKDKSDVMLINPNINDVLFIV